MQDGRRRHLPHVRVLLQALESVVRIGEDVVVKHQFRDHIVTDARLPRSASLLGEISADRANISRLEIDTVLV